MLATVIILAIIVVIAVIFFAVRTANLHNAIEDIYAKQALLQENSHDHEDRINDHEDRIDVNYKSIAELNRRQDELAEAAHESEHPCAVLLKPCKTTTPSARGKHVKPYCGDRTKAGKEAVEANWTSKAPDTPATDPRETRDAKQTAAANRQRFAVLRKTMSVRETAKALGVSLTTAKRYEKWRKANGQ